MAKEDGRKNNGGHKNAGRKSKADELKARQKIKTALTIIFDEQDEDKAEIDFLVDFGQTKDGMKFFAEHLLGKAPDKVEIDQPEGNGLIQVTLGNVAKDNAL